MVPQHHLKQPLSTEARVAPEYCQMWPQNKRKKNVSAISLLTFVPTPLPGQIPLCKVISWGLPVLYYLAVLLN